MCHDSRFDERLSIHCVHRHDMRTCSQVAAGEICVLTLAYMTVSTHARGACRANMCPDMHVDMCVDMCVDMYDMCETCV